MTNKEVLLLFKSDYSLSGNKWKTFCRRYAFRNINTVILYVKKSCEQVNEHIPNDFSDYLKSVLMKEF